MFEQSRSYIVVPILTITRQHMPSLEDAWDDEHDYDVGGVGRGGATI